MDIYVYMYMCIVVYVSRSESKKWKWNRWCREYYEVVYISVCVNSFYGC